MLERKPKRYRYPLELISIVVWSYHRFNDSYRDVSERLLYRGIDVSYETIRQWCIKFGAHFKNVIKKRTPRPSDLDEQQLRIRGATYYLWRAVAQGVIALMGQTRNLFAVAVGRYTKPAQQRRSKFQAAKGIWNNAASELLCA